MCELCEKQPGSKAPDQAERRVDSIDLFCEKYSAERQMIVDLLVLFFSKEKNTSPKINSVNTKDKDSEIIPKLLTFGKVLEYLQGGLNRFARKGWNGKNQYIQLQMPYEGSRNTEPYIYIVIAGQKNSLAPDGYLDLPAKRVPWIASQTDMLANDWFACNS